MHRLPRSRTGKPMQTITAPRVTYLNVTHTLASWLLTKDHKRIALLYLVSVTFAFFLGGLFASLIRLELATPAGDLVTSDTYNRLFTMHGVAMVFFVLIPAVPAILGNFVLPLMLGAKDVAFPKINLLSWYVFVIGFLFTIYAMVTGGVDTGWTFYTPYSSRASSSNVMMTGIGVFITGFSSILTGLNFMVTIHRMRAPGLTWFRLPLFVWAVYATSLVQVLGTPVIAITVLALAVERGFGFGIFDPALGGDPVLFQHMFWFYSHPAVYIMILPPMGAPPVRVGHLGLLGDGVLVPHLRRGHTVRGEDVQLGGHPLQGRHLAEGPDDLGHRVPGPLPGRWPHGPVHRRAGRGRAHPRH